ncbi:MAG: hypothetical protein ACP5F6_06410 [Microbacter sp.]
MSGSSLEESHYNLILSKDLNYIYEVKFNEPYQETSSIATLLTVYCNGIRNNLNNKD